MTRYEKKWHDLTAVDPANYLDLFNERADMVILTVRDTVVDDISGLTLYVRLLFQILNFKGPFSEELYHKHQKLLSAAVGYDISYEESLKISSQARREYKEFAEFTENVQRLLRKIPEDIKEDIITFCLLLGSEEGRPIYKVRNYLAKFYEE